MNPRTLRPGSRWNRWPRNSRLGGIGDSITAAGNGFRNWYSAISSGAFLTYAKSLPRTGETVSYGKLLDGPIKAVSGVATNYIANTLLPQMLAISPRPGLCTVMGGTNNDLSTDASQNACAADMKKCWLALLNAKILPVACGIPTKPTARAYIPAYNAKLETEAARLGIPYVDFFPLTDNGVDGWKPGYCGNPGAGDNHPSVLGATVMGQALRDLLDPYCVKFNSPTLVTSTTDAAPDLVWQNGAMLDDADLDGKPDGGSPQAANGWNIALGSADIQNTLVAEPGVVSGNWWRFNKFQNTTGTLIMGTANATPGDRMGVGFLIKFLNPQTGSSFNLSIYDVPSTLNVFLSLIWTNTDASSRPFMVWNEFTVPADATGVRFYLNINGGTIDNYLGQYTLRKL